MRVIFHIPLLILHISPSTNLLSGNDEAEKQYGRKLGSYRRGRSTHSDQREIIQDLSKLLDEKLYKMVQESKRPRLRSDLIRVEAAKPLREPCGVKKYYEPGKQYNDPTGTCMPALLCDPEFLVLGDAGCSTDSVCCSTHKINHSDDLGAINKRGQKSNNITRRKDAYDPVNSEQANFRRQNKQAEAEEPPGLSYSTSLELKDMKQEWHEDWIKNKVAAMKAKVPKGDVVNMEAARPWGKPCGDPNQHDMPSGNCLLVEACDAEFRIPRGDAACGRTKLVCCAILHTNYDMNQALEASFYDSGLSTSSEEKRNKGIGSEEMAHRQKHRDKKRRQKDRHRRKKKLKENIEKMIKSIGKNLKRQYSNRTTARKGKIKQLKKFLKDLKNRFREDRKVAHSVNEIEMVKLDAKLMTRLGQIRDMNVKFIQNHTFRDILINGKMSRSAARMLVEAYPDLSPYVDVGTRRSGNADKPKDYLDYDVEYGMLYY